MSTQFQTMKSLRNKEYREAFVRSQVNVGIPFQVRALREKRGWNQTQLAEASGMLQPRISAIERPGESKLNLETLFRLAAAFDVGLVVRFAPFSEMLKWSEGFSPDTFAVPSFEQDVEQSRTSAASAATFAGTFANLVGWGTPTLSVGNALAPAWLESSQCGSIAPLLNQPAGSLPSPQGQFLSVFPEPSLGLAIKGCRRESAEQTRAAVETLNAAMMPSFKMIDNSVPV